MNTQTLLIELGTAELPPKALKMLSDAFSKEIVSGLLEANLIEDSQNNPAISYASPRRLAICVQRVQAEQHDQQIERRGPAVVAAFGEDGAPTPAALGFAKSCGVEIGELDRVNSDKGEWLSYTMQQKGKSIAELAPEVLHQAVKRLPIPKRMRWGSGDAEFVRPVLWLVALHGADLLPLTALGKTAGNTTRGHRFLGSDSIVISHADKYAETLLKKGQVVASFEEREAQIKEQIKDLAKSVDGTIDLDPTLLREVTGLVEQPNAILGKFDPEFLEVPKECLISSMRDHQKYFHLKDKQGALLPNFITVSNIQSKDPEREQLGNERVLRARLSDARFFWHTDQKMRLEERAGQLGNVLFHAKLGSVSDKSGRVGNLSEIIADRIGANAELTKRAAFLAKADLVTDMVNEFDELQGIMGHYYADLDGEDPLVGAAIEQHYWPKFAGDNLPESSEAQAVALADKLDSLVGIFASGEVPTGDKDPYALRRAALGILRILIEKNIPLQLSDLVAEAASVFAEQQFKIKPDVQGSVVDFVRGRLTALYKDQGIATNTINAVMACQPDNPVDFDDRVKAVDSFSRMAEAEDLAAANKRIGNILKKQKTAAGNEVEPALLVEPAETALNAAIDSIEKSSHALFDQGNYTKGLQQLASLRSPVDDFFEHVMVMSDDPKQRNNRLALLNKMQQLFLRVADISLLQS